MSKDRVEELKSKITDLKKRWPAHSVPAAMMEQLDELEEALRREEEMRSRSGENSETGVQTPPVRTIGHLELYQGAKMNTPIKLGIIICDRYRRCAGGKCFRALANREGAFSIYANQEVELVGYTSCDGCPGGNIEYAGDEMVKNGAQVIHLATGLIVGYPPCPNICTFKDFLEQRYNLKVVVGTHPIPQKYLDMQTRLGTWVDPAWESLLEPTLADQETRIAYN